MLLESKYWLFLIDMDISNEWSTMEHNDREKWNTSNASLLVYYT